MKRLLLAAFAAVITACAVIPASAQTASTSVTLSWTAPTKNTDGSAITGTLTYNLYQGPAAGPFVKVASNITGTSDVVTSLSAGNCFAVTAVETGSATSTESALSNTSCDIVPGSPSGLTITVTVTVK
jgi:hypothetical protein